jgi:transcriptional regulatory protein RtcR
VEPNLDYELAQLAERTGHAVGMNREAREEFLAFATSPEARWPGNFRDFGGAISRMATLATGGRIDSATAREEIERLRAAWTVPGGSSDDALLERHLGRKAVAETDLFDRVQLAAVLRVCAESKGLSDAGRKLFAASRARKSSTNDADRLRKYLARFGLEWAEVAAAR